MMHQCDYCCWYNERYGNCDCPYVMKKSACDKAKRRKKGVRNERIGTLCNRNNRETLLSRLRKRKYRWWLKVKAICYGTESETTLMFDSESDALNVCKGYMFLA